MQTINQFVSLDKIDQGYDNLNFLQKRRALKDLDLVKALWNDDSRLRRFDSMFQWTVEVFQGGLRDQFQPEIANAILEMSGRMYQKNSYTDQELFTNLIGPFIYDAAVEEANKAKAYRHTMLNSQHLAHLLGTNVRLEYLAQNLQSLTTPTVLSQLEDSDITVLQSEIERVITRIEHSERTLLNGISDYRS